MLRRIVKKGLRVAQDWLRGDDDTRFPDDTPIAYPAINALHVQIIREAPLLVRPGYLWGSLHGAHLAKTLGFGSVSLIEFGVAGGNGLVALELIADRFDEPSSSLGWWEETVPLFVSTHKPAPVAFVSVELDLYTSTKQALRLFEADSSILLPRVHCYFDDINGFTFADHNGERLAIAEFNQEHPLRKYLPCITSGITYQRDALMTPG